MPVLYAERALRSDRTDGLGWLTLGLDYEATAEYP